jgi:Tol biopolymer transport system component
MPMLALTLAAFNAFQPAAPAQPRRLTYVVHAYANFAPGDDSIVFQSNASGNWDLYTMRASGEGIVRITDDPAADITPVYSRDGARIVFVSERRGNRDVMVCNADGSDPRFLTDDPGHDIHPVWSAEGARIMFSSNRGNDDPADYDIYEMASDGTDLRRITSGPEVDTYSSRSPDGRKIVTRRVIGGNNEVFVLDADGSNPVNLTSDAERYDGWPVWSPDGAWIAFASGRMGAGDHRVNVVRPDGTGRAEATGPEPGSTWCYDTQPAWSHDGRRIVFTRYANGPRESAELCIVPAPLEAAR